MLTKEFLGWFPASRRPQLAPSQSASPSTKKLSSPPRAPRLPILSLSASLQLLALSSSPSPRASTGEDASAAAEEAAKY